MPDSLAPLRPHAVCAPGEILCPRCNQPVTRFTVGEGSALARCERKVGDASFSRFRDPCGQHIYVAGGEGFAVVFPITREEFEYLTATVLGRPAMVLTILGVLRARDRATVPEQECTECHERRKTFDLYQGVCRWCRGEQQVSA